MVVLEEKKIKGKNLAKLWAIAWTIIYVILTPILFCTGLLSVLFTYNEVTTTLRWSLPGVLILVLMAFSIPLSLIASIYLMWSSYSRKLYRRTLIYGVLPLINVYLVFPIFMLGLLVCLLPILYVVDLVLSWLS